MNLKTLRLMAAFTTKKLKAGIDFIYKEIIS
jgi:hypothetical protein